MARWPPTVEPRAQIWDESGGICHYCGKVMHPIRDFTIDHVIPRCRGGTDERSNLVAACWDCNYAKRGAPPAPSTPAPLQPPPLLTPKHKRLLTPAETAKVLRVHPQTLRRWADSGKVPVVRLPSGQRRFQPAAIERIEREMLRRYALDEEDADDVPTAG